MVMFTLNFSHIVNGQRIPFLIDGKEAVIQVEANDKTAAIWHEKSVQFCTEHGVTIRSVT